VVYFYLLFIMIFVHKINLLVSIGFLGIYAGFVVIVVIQSKLQKNTPEEA